MDEKLLLKYSCGLINGNGNPALPFEMRLRKFKRPYFWSRQYKQFVGKKREYSLAFVNVRHSVVHS